MRVLSVAFMVMLSTSAVAVDRFRCNGGDLVQTGDPKSSVLEKCGAPMKKDSWCQELHRQATPPQNNGQALVVVPQNNAPLPCEPIEEWTYNPGVGQFYTTIRIEGDVVQSIRYGDRVN